MEKPPVLDTKKKRRFGNESVSEKLAREKEELEAKAKEAAQKKEDAGEYVPTTKEEILEHTGSIVEKARKAKTAPGL